MAAIKPAAERLLASGRARQQATASASRAAPAMRATTSSEGDWGCAPSKIMTTDDGETRRAKPAIASMSEVTLSKTLFVASGFVDAGISFISEFIPGLSRFAYFEVFGRFQSNFSRNLRFANPGLYIAFNQQRSRRGILII
ncbi:hypothetical protein AB4099_08635 [Bosea sp. 2KB_26]|uniref:hypothetical protein n=1 Tax=Bosea sp. 2KB_26 TaxID=3237475 RepID=UPI003F92FE1F